MDQLKITKAHDAKTGTRSFRWGNRLPKVAKGFQPFFYDLPFLAGEQGKRRHQLSG
jgi:hypothetical protein